MVCPTHGVPAQHDQLASGLCLYRTHTRCLPITLDRFPGQRKVSTKGLVQGLQKPNHAMDKAFSKLCRTQVIGSTLAVNRVGEACDPQRKVLMAIKYTPYGVEQSGLSIIKF